jgi:hypothetical protein
MTRHAAAILGTVVIHLGVAAGIASIPRVHAMDAPPLELELVHPPPPSPAPSEPPAPAPEAAPGAVAPAAAKTRGKPRRRATPPVPTPAVAEPAPEPEAVATEAPAEEGPSAEGEAGNGTAAATAPAMTPAPSPPGPPRGVSLARGPEPLSDYSAVSLPLAPSVLSRYEGREVVLDLFIDERGKVHHAKRLEGVESSVDRVVAEVSEEFHFAPARDATGRPTPGVVTFRFQIRPPGPGRPAPRPRASTAPLLASASLRASSAGRPVPAPRGEDEVDSAPRTAEQRASGRTLARGLGGTLFGAGDAVLAPSRGESGLARHRPIAGLTRRERNQLCHWAVTVRGGEGNASSCLYPEDRDVTSTANRWRWNTGVTSPDGAITTPWWFGGSGVIGGSEDFTGRIEAPTTHRGSIAVTTGKRGTRMRGPARVSQVEREAVCVSALEEAEVCHITVADMEACNAALQANPCTGGESYACKRVQNCGELRE